MYRKISPLFLILLLAFGFSGIAFANPTPSCVLTSDKAEVIKGRWIELSWDVTGVGYYYLQLEGFDNTFPSTQDHIVFTPRESMTYKLSVINSWGENTCETYVEVVEPEPANEESEVPSEPTANFPIDTILLMGSNGPDVRILQEMLNTQQSAELKVDGIFGPKTKAAVEAFQTANQAKVDGIVGSETWGKLVELAG